MKFNRYGILGKICYNMVTPYNHEKFWKMRQCVVDSNNKKNIFIKMIYLMKIKRVEAKNCSSIGTAMNTGASFKGIPDLPHGITGIFISHSAVIGENCTILQNVTIGSSKKKAPIIGDNCIIGAGAVLIGGIRIGNNVRIGANCTVSKDVPDNCTVVSVQPRIIKREQGENIFKF